MLDSGEAGVDPVSMPNPAVSSVLDSALTDKPVGYPALHDLKGKTARGALVSAIGQGANFIVRIGSMVYDGSVRGRLERLKEVLIAG